MTNQFQMRTRGRGSKYPKKADVINGSSLRLALHLVYAGFGLKKRKLEPKSKL